MDSKYIENAIAPLSNIVLKDARAGMPKRFPRRIKGLTGNDLPVPIPWLEIRSRGGNPSHMWR
jgi:hypothetical protein